MLLTEAEFDAYLNDLVPDQAESIRIVRALIRECEPTLSESVCTDKWYGGLLVYAGSNNYPVYALGPRVGGKTTLHMMPFYGSATHQSRHGEALKKFISGKSCLLFKHAKDLPFDALRDIMTGGSGRLLQALAERDESRKTRAKKSS